MALPLNKRGIEALHNNSASAERRLTDLLDYFNQLPDGPLADEVTLALEIVAAIDAKSAVPELINLLRKYGGEADSDTDVVPDFCDELARTLTERSWAC
jgi:hypothetical protein